MIVDSLTSGMSNRLALTFISGSESVSATCAFNGGANAAKYKDISKLSPARVNNFFMVV
jgi:hypothetical protein